MAGFPKRLFRRTGTYNAPTEAEGVTERTTPPVVADNNTQTLPSFKTSEAQLDFCHFRLSSILGNPGKIGVTCLFAYP